MTREHVFAHWLIRKVHGAQLVASASGTADQPPRIARMTAPVCAVCNAGWMSGLEVSFRRAVFARPRVGEIRMPDRVTVSRWFAKTAALVAEANGVGIASPEQRAQLVLGLPDDLEVFLARRRRPRQRLDYAFDVGSDATRARVVALSVDQLVAHVAQRGTLGSHHGTRLWPLRSHLLRWETLPVITPLLVRDLAAPAK
jgi:hypothetical protein